MTNREWLKQGMKLTRQIDELKEALERAQTDYGYAQGLFRAEYKPSELPVETAISLVYQQEISAKIALKQAVLADIANRIDQLDNDTVKAVMLARYVNCKTLEQIADEQYYSVKQISRILRLGEQMIKRG